MKKKILCKKNNNNCENSEGATNVRRSCPTNFDCNRRVSAVKVAENSWLSKLPKKKKKEDETGDNNRCSDKFSHKLLHLKPTSNVGLEDLNLASLEKAS